MNPEDVILSEICHYRKTNELCSTHVKIKIVDLIETERLPEFGETKGKEQ